MDRSFFVFGFRLQHLLLHQFSGFRKMWPFTIVFDQSQVFLVKDKDWVWNFFRVRSWEFLICIFFFCSINTFFFSVHLVSLDSQASSMNTWNFSQILGYLQQHEHTGNIKNLPYSIFEKEVQHEFCSAICSPAKFWKWKLLQVVNGWLYLNLLVIHTRFKVRLISACNLTGCWPCTVLFFRKLLVTEFSSGYF